MNCYNLPEGIMRVVFPLVGRCYTAFFMFCPPLDYGKLPRCVASAASFTESISASNMMCTSRMAEKWRLPDQFGASNMFQLFSTSRRPDLEAK